MNYSYKDPELKGIYVMRCKCGNRPSYDRCVSPPTTHWLSCDCGKHGEISLTKQGAIDEWNNKKFIYEII